jgi:hypothetical protein
LEVIAIIAGVSSLFFMCNSAQNKAIQDANLMKANAARKSGSYWWRVKQITYHWDSRDKDVFPEQS